VFFNRHTRTRTWGATQHTLARGQSRPAVLASWPMAAACDARNTHMRHAPEVRLAAVYGTYEPWSLSLCESWSWSWSVGVAARDSFLTGATNLVGSENENSFSVCWLAYALLPRGRSKCPGNSLRSSSSNSARAARRVCWFVSEYAGVQTTSHQIISYHVMSRMHGYGYGPGPRHTPTKYMDRSMAFTTVAACTAPFHTTATAAFALSAAFTVSAARTCHAAMPISNKQRLALPSCPPCPQICSHCFPDIPSSGWSTWRTFSRPTTSFSPVRSRTRTSTLLTVCCRGQT
jgi:hypothetical protein